MTTYRVSASRVSADPADDYWLLQCLEHPGAISETRDLGEAPELMREAISWVAQVPEEEVDVQVVITDAR